MVKYLVSFLLVAFSVSAFAQSAPVLKGNGQINGIVLDTDTKSPIEYATVILYSKGAKNAIGGATANEKGL